jgi:hypothetical protein
LIAAPLAASGVKEEARVLRLAFVVGTAFVVAACSASVPSVPSDAGRRCQAIAQAAPQSASIHVSETIVVGTTWDGGCPRPLVRNETPDVVGMDTVGLATIRLTGIVPGRGRIRVRSGVDTMVSMVVPIDVVP